MRMLIPLATAIVLLVVNALPQYRQASRGAQAAAVVVILAVFLAVEAAAIVRRARRARAARRPAPSYPYTRR